MQRYRRPPIAQIIRMVPREQVERTPQQPPRRLLLDLRLRPLRVPRRGHLPRRRHILLRAAVVLERKGQALAGALGVGVRARRVAAGGVLDAAAGDGDTALVEHRRARVLIIDRSELQALDYGVQNAESSRAPGRRVQRVRADLEERRQLGIMSLCAR